MPTKEVLDVYYSGAYWSAEKQDIKRNLDNITILQDHARVVNRNVYNPEIIPRIPRDPTQIRLAQVLFADVTRSSTETGYEICRSIDSGIPTFVAYHTKDAKSPLGIVIERLEGENVRMFKYDYRYNLERAVANFFDKIKNKE